MYGAPLLCQQQVNDKNMGALYAPPLFMKIQPNTIVKHGNTSYRMFLTERKKDSFSLYGIGPKNKALKITMIDNVVTISKISANLIPVAF